MQRLERWLREQSAAWQRGERVLVEVYRDREGLHDDADALLDLICNEVFLREQRGEHPTVGEYLKRFPELASQLREHFEVQRALEEKPAEGMEAAEGLENETVLDNESPTLQETRIAPGYEILGELGRGGMGVVYKARQLSLGRLVALKMINSGDLSARSRQRFRDEAETVASLDHPHIVPIFEVGERDAQPFFSMKLLEGGSLHRRLPRYRADPRGAVQVLIAVAQAVHYAHQRGILHRDLKPSNILFDSAGQAYVADFGLAKRVEEERSLTQSTDLAGTPSYMAAEQASGAKGLITTATDVYGLGAVLYALLTGKAPFQGETLLETLQLVKEAEPERPSRSNPHVDRDLEMICLKCLEKEPGKRYASAGQLAEELQHYLNSEPLLYTRPVGRVERIRRWCRRKPLVASLTGGLLVALVAGLAGVVWQWLRAEAALEAAVEQEYKANMNLAQVLLLEGADPTRVQEVLDHYQPRRGRKDLRDEQWHHLAWLCKLHSPATLPPQEGPVYAVALGGDGQRLVTGGAASSGTLKVWDAATRKLLHVLPQPGAVKSLALAGAGNILAAASEDGTVMLWDIATGAELHTHDLPGVISLAFGEGGKVLVTASADGAVTLWNTRTWEELQTFVHPRANCVALAPDGSTLAAGSVDGKVKVWNLATNKGFAVTRFDKASAHEGAVLALAYAADGGTLASGGQDQNVIVWNLEPLVEAEEAPVEQTILSREVQGHVHWVTALAFGRNNQTLASASWDGTAKLWNLREPTRPLVTLKGHTDRFWSLAFSPDDMTLVTSSEEGTVKLWNVSKQQKR